ncbi:MAG: hypothetical protein Tsb0032_20610 [Kiloniellaceae bacterium]
MKWNSLVFALVFGAGALGLGTAPAEAGAILQVSDGRLLGAKNVDIGGTLYDVTFQNGTCSELNSGCDEASDFMFQTYNDGMAAGAALRDQVLLDSPLGLFDSISGLTGGCTTLANTCNILFGITLNGALATNPSRLHAIVVNNRSSGSDNVSYTLEWHIRNTTGINNMTWASFSLAGSTNAIPEPSTLLLFAGGLLGLAGAASRRRRG